jgi:RND family efflux transporter MFP subunit
MASAVLSWSSLLSSHFIMKEIIMIFILMKNKIKNMSKAAVTGVSVGVAVAVLGFGHMLFGKNNGYANVPKADDPVRVSTTIVQPRMIDSLVAAAGSLNSRNVSILSSKIMGRVMELKVQEGSNVSAGQVLMRIESGEISAQLYQAQAAFNNAQLQYERIKSLFDAEAATKMEMDQATLGLESAKAGLNAAKAMESYTVLTAPIGGHVVEKHINAGEMALPGQPILKIEDNRNLRLEVTVAEREIGSIRPGQAVAVRIDALPDKEFKGRVAQVVSAADARTHSFMVKIDVPADKNLITGMYGRVFFSTGKHQAILVPRSALVEMSGLSGVYIVSPDGKAVFQMIQPGDTLGDMIEAVKGLKKGDMLIVDKQDASIEGKNVLVAQK